MLIKRSIACLVAAATLAGSLTVSAAPAQARGRGGLIAAGIIGGLALGAVAAHAAEPQRVYVVERRHGRHTRKHRCGCVHVYHHR